MLRSLRTLALPMLVAAGSTACSTSFETPTTLSSTERLAAGERRLLAVEEYADSAALAEMGVLYLPPVSIAPQADIDGDIPPARLDDVRRQLSQDVCQRLARAGFDVRPVPTEAGESGEMPDVEIDGEVLASVSGIRRNNVATTGVSRLLGAAVPGPLNPRVPLGIGALGVEAEILDREGRQVAAIRWASRNHLASGGGVTTILDGPDAFTNLADVMDLSSVFADALGDLVAEARAGQDVVESETPRGTCDAYRELIDAEIAPQPEMSPA
ncbi:hypothetical protein [uncultured Maricaulis sp.]|uniref:hypothetical protein n=1 Tax=uncultured Maricaulis sp. TaxID=174710 RepID=UPI0026152085|nr:hypothetical protein [uncultured Maricaulis sp.]